MKKTLFLFATAGVLISSCVSSKKYVATDAKFNKLQNENTITQNQLKECNAQVIKLKEEKTTIQSANDSINNDLNILTSQSNLTIADQAKRLAKLQGMIAEQKEILNKLKSSMDEALNNYSTEELNIYVKNGNVYVSLEEKLLFKSGSDVVDPKGKEAIKTLAKVLNTTKDITVMIEGHTDNAPIKTKIYEDNWDLSIARATSIVRILTKDGNFDPKRVTASGKSLYHPVKSNANPQGRANNRRTEIILTPDLKELYKILEEK